MRVLLWGMGGLLAALLYLLMLGEGGLWDLREQAREHQRLELENEKLAERNRILAAELENLRAGAAGVEGISREELGMIREGEEFYQFTGPGLGGKAKTPSEQP